MSITTNKRRHSGVTRRISSTQSLSKSGKYTIEINHAFEGEGLTEVGAGTLEECEMQFNHTQVEVYIWEHTTDYEGYPKKEIINSRRTLFRGEFNGEVLGVVSGYNQKAERDYFKHSLSPAEAHIAVMNFANKWLKQ